MKLKMKQDKEPKVNIVSVCKECSEQIHQDWQKKNKDLHIEEGDYIKIALTDKKRTEHMWFKVDLVVNEKEFIHNSVFNVFSNNYKLLLSYKFHVMGKYFGKLDTCECLAISHCFLYW